jgi:hypothetical protein
VLRQVPAIVNVTLVDGKGGRAPLHLAVGLSASEGRAWARSGRKRTICFRGEYLEKQMLTSGRRFSSF